MSSHPHHPSLRVNLSDDGVLHLALGGKWQMSAKSYPDTQVVSKMVQEKREKIKHVVCEAEDVEAWDALLVAFLHRLWLICNEVGLECRSHALPDGVEEMLQLQDAAAHQPASDKDAENLTFRERFHDLAEEAGHHYLAIQKAADRVLTYIGELVMSFGRLLRRKAYFRPKDFVHSLSACGPEALIIVTLISFLVGMTLAFVGLMQLKEFGADIFVANMVVISMAREMGAMMTGIIMAGRTASSYAARLGTMVVNQEVDALETTGIKPMDFLVLPRVMALVAMMPWLTIYSITVGILGGAFIAITMRDITLAGYWNQTIEAVNANDFYAGFIKSVVFGIVVAMAGCYHGLRCGRSSEAVGKVTTSAVVSAIVFIIIWDSILTVVYDITNF